MSSPEKGRPLPKFGEWDVNNPASADVFSVVFARARDEKKANKTSSANGGGGGGGQKKTPQTNRRAIYHYPKKERKWRCCF